MIARGRRQAEQTAERLLVEHGHTATVPVPVEAIAKELGVAIRREHFDAPDVSGVLIREPGQTPVIGVNTATVAVRQRFTVAHELGHFLLHQGKRLVLDRAVRVNFRDNASSLATDAEEIEANAFAASLLMPSGLVLAELHKQLRGRPCSDSELVERLATRFKVSRSAMEFRLINLGHLTPT